MDLVAPLCSLIRLILKAQQNKIIPLQVEHIRIKSCFFVCIF